MLFAIVLVTLVCLLVVEIRHRRDYAWHYEWAREEKELRWEIEWDKTRLVLPHRSPLQEMAAFARLGREQRIAEQHRLDVLRQLMEHRAYFEQQQFNQRRRRGVFSPFGLLGL
jgi:hypothetical protein